MNKNNIKTIISILFISLLIIGVAHAEVVVNSVDGRDSVSAIYFANLIGQKVVFATLNQPLEVFLAKIGTGQDIIYIEGNTPVYNGVKEIIEQKNNITQYIKIEDSYKTNKELAKLSNATKYYVVDDTYGYNTVSLLSYAKYNKAYLLFTNEEQAQELKTFLEQQKPEYILIYGYVDNKSIAAIKNTTNNYEIINYKDKYDNNLEIVKRTMELTNRKQIILSDGNAIEEVIASGNDPVLFINYIIPESTYSYLKQSLEEGKIKVMLLIGEEYSQTTYDLKKRLEKETNKSISLIVKFGETVPAISPTPMKNNYIVLPAPILNLTIEEINYNKNTNKLEVIFRNNGAPVYEKSNIKLLLNNKPITTFVDSNLIYIDRELFGVEYDMPKIDEGLLSVNITTKYGISKKYFEKGFIYVGDVSKVTYVDNSNLTIKNVKNDLLSGDLTITIENNKNEKAYYLINVKIIGKKNTTIKDDKVREVLENEISIVRYPGIMREVEGDKALITITYGSREAFLRKKEQKEFELDKITNYWWILIILAIIIYLIWRHYNKKNNYNRYGL